MSRVVDTPQIEQSINQFLGQDTWNNNHLQFYEMLLRMATRYNQRAHHYKNYANDNTDIINNVREQPWFQMSQKQDKIIRLLEHMHVEEIATEPAYVVRLNFESNLWFMVEFLDRQHKGKREVKYRVSFCDNMDDHAYICYYSSQHPRSRKLPEYEKLERYLPDLSRYDIVMLANELVIYYDCQHNLNAMPMGHDYPITLGKLVKEIIQQLQELQEQ